MIISLPISRLELNNNPAIPFSLPLPQLILANLQQQQKEIDEITAKNRSGPNDPELNQLVVQLREKLSLLVARASQGITLINVRFQFIL